MSTGAFRDASAAIERAAMLEEENRQLREELEELGKLRIEVEEVRRLRAENAELRAIARSENEGAFMTRLSEEREELAGEVSTLRERLATQERELARLHRVVQLERTSVEPLVERVLAVFRRK